MATIPQRLPADRAHREWRLLPGRVVRLACDAPGRLTAREGGLWVTFDAMAGTDRRPQDDHFLQEGEGLGLEAGDVVVVSAEDPRYGLALFDWEPARVSRPAPLGVARAALLQLLARLSGPELAVLA